MPSSPSLYTLEILLVKAHLEFTWLKIVRRIHKLLLRLTMFRYLAFVTGYNFNWTYNPAEYYDWEVTHINGEEVMAYLTVS